MLKRRTLSSGAVSWRARYEDPDTGRVAYVTLDALLCSTAEGRRRWAIAKAKSLAKRRDELAGGAQRAEAKDLAEAIKDYIEGAENRLRGRTLTVYKLAIDPFAAWAGRNGVRSTADLTRSKLSAYRDHLIARPLRASQKGGKRGQWKEGKKRRSPESINRELRTLKTVLNTWRAAGRLPSLDRDAIADTLKALPTPRPEPEYLRPAQLEKLLRAALRHDAALFKLTRDELMGRRAKGTTLRYVPIARFLALLVLSGMRRGEALGLRWADCDLSAKDHEGRTVGEIRLRAEATKTHHARTIGLEVSPALRGMLAAMKLRAGNAGEHVFEWVDKDGERHAYTADLVEAARKRLRAEYGAPSFSWQLLRSTCATYLTNAAGIWGSASAFYSAKQLGHSIAVAERNYLGVHRGVSKDARTLEAVMQLEGAMLEVIATAGDVQTGDQRALSKKKGSRQ